MPLVLRAAHVISALSVRGPCVARADSELPQFNYPKTAHTLPSTYVLRTYNGRFAH